MRWDQKDHCVNCGRFIKYDAPGVSWSQTWGYDMSGTPDLHDPRYRCGPCTAKHGPMETNCANPDAYKGMNPVSQTIGL